MKQDINEVYYASLIENVEFTEGELKRMKIAFIKTLGEITPALIKLGVQNFGPGSELVDHGFTLAQVGPLSNPHWVIYSVDLNFENVSDVFNKKNFYDISKETLEGRKVIFSKVHLRTNNVEQDMTYYIELDSKYKSSPYEVFSEYVQ